MPRMYRNPEIPEKKIPAASAPVFQHLVDTYAGEANKLAEVWRMFSDEDLEYRPHAKSRTVAEQMRHQLLSERRFFGEFLGMTEPEASHILPPEQKVDAFADRMATLALRRLEGLAWKEEEWWLQRVPFFDVERQRIWIFWRRILHTAHHRAQLTVYLRLLNKPVPAVYGPTADATWIGADPTTSIDSAKRA